ncbi:GNAT family N-acetyltransferase [Paenibacillus sp. J5C2022]|uniref:GNAT family N-acetyltransferase n=1 Tax=Paenibacillus sp. J5C2022 TaxID=2977129 RepID=UPI0021CED57D|nr:GNAT family N-acetyltransferase [Paenibacillus sp. J5C2022]
MPDMLVKLYDLPEHENAREYERRTGVAVRRAIAPEKHVITEWVRNHFNAAWASECEAGMARCPVTCLVAVEDGKLLGFSCYDATMRGFFGPTGVAEGERGRGVGKMLFLHAMELMRLDGYGYAIIGAAGPTAFYEGVAGATVIEGSVPGIYRGMLRQQ